MYVDQQQPRESRADVQKKLIVDALGSKEAAIEHRTAVYLGGAAIAEWVLMCRARTFC